MIQYIINLDFLKKYSERVQKSKEVIQKAWNFEKVPYIPTIVYNYPNYTLDQKLLVSWDKYLLEKELSLTIKIKSIKDHLKKLDDDYIPYIDTFMGTPVSASSFDAKVRFFKDKDPWIIDRAIKSIKEIDKLKKPDTKKSGLTKIILDFIDYWKIETNDKIPISIPDIQSPVSVGIDLMGAEKFYLGLLDDPNRIHKLLEIITEVIIDFLKILIPKVEHESGFFEWTGIYFPKNKGKVRISEDNLVSVSSNMYLEFMQPYHEMIFKETGGGIIHWCGDGSNNFSNILEIDNLTGVHNSSMGDLNLIADQVQKLNIINNKFNKKIVYFNSMGVPSSEKMVNKILKVIKKNNGYINQIFNTNTFGSVFYLTKSGPSFGKFVDEPQFTINSFLKKRMLN